MQEKAKALSYTFKTSEKLRARKEESLRGVVVLIADCGHYDSIVQERIHHLLGWLSQAQPGGSAQDILLVEGQAKDETLMTDLCRGWDRSKCWGIDNPDRRDRIDKIGEPFSRALTALLQALIVGGDEGAKEAITKTNNYGTVLDIWLKSGVLQDKTEPEAATFMKEHWNLMQALDQFGEAWESYQLAQILDRCGPGHATYVVLGAAHVATLQSKLMSTTETILIAERAWLESENANFAEWDET